MNEARLRQLLHEAPLPDAAEAERRGLELVEAAFAERAAARGTPARLSFVRRSRRKDNHTWRAAALRPALVLVLAALIAALVLSPAGAAVRDWVGDVLATSKTPRPQRGLAEVPGGGNLVVQSSAGPWVVQADGSRRLLGDYTEATWSPRGLYLAVTSGRQLSAVEPDGTPRWSITAPGVVLGPRWAPSRYRIAYRSGRSLRVVAADGSADRLLAPVVAPIAPAWDPRHRHLLAYVGARGELRIGESEGRRSLSFGPALRGATTIAWQGNRLLEASAAKLRLRRVSDSGAGPGAGPHQIAVMLPNLPLGLPHGARVLAATLSPNGRTVAASVTLPAGGPIARKKVPASADPDAPARNAVYLFDARDGARRRLLALPDSLTQLAFSPDSARLLIAWPRLDQWLFLPVAPGTEGRSLVGIAAAFGPGQREPSFPRVEGWCCAAPGDA
jgi:hypothetical protein